MYITHSQRVTGFSRYLNIKLSMFILQTHRGQQERCEELTTCEHFLRDLCVSGCVRRQVLLHMRCFRDMRNTIHSKKHAQGTTKYAVAQIDFFEFFVTFFYLFCTPGAVKSHV